VAERKNHTIIEVVCAMLHDQGLPKFLWAEAANIVVYVQNRCPHQALDSKTPDEMFTSKKLDVSHFRIFEVSYIFMCQKRKEANWLHHGRKESLWAIVKILRAIEFVWLVKGKLR